MAATTATAAPLASHPVVSEPPLEACLLLAQAVAQQGTKDWDAIAKLLDNSQYWPAEAGRMTSQVTLAFPALPLLDQVRKCTLTDRFHSQGYQGAFDEIMRERGLDPYVPSRRTRPRWQKP